MATGFGVNLDAQKNGTSPEDIQAITAAEYANPGIIAGVDVTTTTGMSYTITSGAVVIQIAPGRMVKAPVHGQTIPTNPAPVTGSRTDIVYIKQNFPVTEGNNQVVAGVATALPANAVEIARFTVPAGATSTKQASPVGNIYFATTVGSSGKLLADAVDSDTTVRREATYTKGNLSFQVPTDRRVELSLSSCVSNASGSDTENGAVLYSFYLDGALVTSFERSFNRYWETKQFETGLTVTKGRHTIHYTVRRVSYNQGGSGEWRVRYGTERKMRGDFLTITDRGVWEG